MNLYKKTAIARTMTLSNGICISEGKNPKKPVKNEDKPLIKSTIVLKISIIRFIHVFTKLATLTITSIFYLLKAFMIKTHKEPINNKFNIKYSLELRKEVQTLEKLFKREKSILEVKSLNNLKTPVPE